MIKITSFKKQEWVNGTPTSNMYSVSAYINPNKIVSIAPTKTSISNHFVEYSARGSKIIMDDGSTLTSDLEPKELIQLINKSK
jgi:hypothetical protein